MEAERNPPLNFHFTLDDFEFDVTQTDEGLILEAEHQGSAQLFTKIITEESVQTISKDPFFDLSTIFQVIKDYFEEKPETASLKLTPDGKLSYNCKISFGKVTKEIGFDVQLDQKEMDVLNNLERAFNKLSNRVSNLEKGENSLDQKALDEKFEIYFNDFEKRLFDRLTGIETRLTKVEKNIQRIENKDGGFDTNSLHASNYKFSNHNRTVTATPSSSEKHIILKEPLPQFKTSKLSFRIENNDQKGLGFGIAPLEVLNQDSPFQSSKAYMYYSTGHIWKNGNGSGSIYPKPSKGDIVTFLIDTKKGGLIVDINGNLVDKHIFKVEDIQTAYFHGFVYTDYTSGSVTLL